VTRKTIAAVARLVRFPNGLVAAAAVIVGGRWAGAEWRSLPVTLAAGSAVALTALANAFNDYQDRSIDCIAHPERPIPSGAIAPGTALGIAVVAGIVGVGFAAAAAPPLGVLSICVAFVMLGYGWVKSCSGVAANAVVAVLGSLPFLYGAWASGAPRAAVPLVALAAPLQFARELAKDVDDVAGDRGRRRTLPLELGGAAARGIAVAAAFLAIIVLAGLGLWRPPSVGASFGWRFAGTLGGAPFTGLFVLPAGLFALFGCWRLMQGRSGAPAAFKVAMVLAIVAMVPLAP
jgi:geranylgeranylglycerol-phosphate geranylgeranyltransferase